MRTRIPTLALILSLSLLTVLPGSYIGLNRAHATNQNGPTSWLPFGPSTNGVLFQYDSDYRSMFNTFQTGGAGGIDLADWPMFAADIMPLCIKADFFCSSPTIQNGLFELDVNHADPFLGVAQLGPRTVMAPSVAITPPVFGCSTGFASLTVTLENQETGNSQVVDPVNSMTMIFVSGGIIAGPSTTVSINGGVYAFLCMLAGTYFLSNSEYANCPLTSPTSCEVTIGSANSY